MNQKDLKPTISANSSFGQSEDTDELSFNGLINSPTKIQDIEMICDSLAELPYITPLPSDVEVRDHIDLVELEEAVRDANRDSIDANKDGLDITLRSFRVRHSSSERKVPSEAVEDLR